MYASKASPSRNQTDRHNHCGMPQMWNKPCDYDDSERRKNDSEL